MGKWSIRAYEFVILIALLRNGACENITMSKMTIEDSKPFVFHKFIYNNETKSIKDSKTGFEYLISISTNYHGNNSTGGFFIFIFNTEIISSFSKLKCGKTEEEGAFLIKKKAEDKPLPFSELGLYNRKIAISKGNFTFEDKIPLEFSGVSKTVLLYCSYNDNPSLKSMKLELNGKVSYYNKNGFGSAEDFYLINLYFILTVYYALISVYWLVKIVLNYKMISVPMTLFSIAIPFVIVENIFRLEFFSEIKKQGTFSLTFKLLAVIFRVIKNTIFRIVFFLLSYKYHKTISKRSKIIFVSALVIYVATAVLYEIAAMKHDHFAFPFIFFFLAILCLEAIKAWIWYILYNQFNKLENDNRIKNITNILQEVQTYSNIIKYTFIIAIVHYVLYLLLRLLQDYFILCYLKWVVDLIHQSISIIIFSGLLFMIKGKDLLHDGYFNEIELEKSGNAEMSTQPREKPELG